MFTVRSRSRSKNERNTVFYLKFEFIIEINLKNMPMKKLNKYNYIVLAIISNTEEYIQDKNGFFLHQKKLRM